MLIVGWVEVRKPNIFYHENKNWGHCAGISDIIIYNTYL